MTAQRVAFHAATSSSCLFWLLDWFHLAVCLAGKAAKLYAKAVKAGSIEGLYSLGWLHAVGQGVPRNISQAAQLYKQAVEGAPDWHHAAPPFAALLLLPFMVALQWLQHLSTAVSSTKSGGGEGFLADNRWASHKHDTLR